MQTAHHQIQLSLLAEFYFWFWVQTRSMKAICENPCHIVGKLLWTKAKTEKKRDVTKIQDCQFIGLVSIFTKKKLKKAPLPKMSLLVSANWWGDKSTGLLWWLLTNSANHQGPVVQKVNRAIHRINHYPVDNAIGFPSTYPLESDLTGG